MHILVANGSTVHLTRHELLQLMRHRYFVGYFLLVLLLVMALKPFNHIYDMDIMTNTLIFIPGSFIYLSIYFGGIVLMDKVGMRPTTFLLWPIATFATASSVILQGQLLELGGVTAKDLTTLYTFHFIVFFVVELVFVSFLLQPCLRNIRGETNTEMAPGHPASTPAPRNLPQTPVGTPVETTVETTSPAIAVPAPEPAPVADRPKMLTLFGQRFQKEDIWAIRAVEHYIEVRNRAGECQLLRGRMAEAEAALPADLGLRVHRSHWVSAQALKRLDRKRDRWQVVLQGGDEVPVARARREQTREWASRVLGPRG